MITIYTFMNIIRLKYSVNINRNYFDLHNSVYQKESK